MPEKVTVLGGGSFGTTLATLLARAGNDVLWWMRDGATVDEVNRAHTNHKYFPDIALPATLRATQDLGEASRHGQMIFVAVPSKAFRGLMRELSPHARAEHMLVHGTKGLEPKTFKTMTVIAQEETAIRRVGAIAGPNLALEILRELPAASVIGSKFDEVIRRVCALLTTPNFLVYGNHDLIGVELGGTLKNVLAIGAGVIDGGELGANAKSLLMTRGLAEMMRFGVHMGARNETFSGLAGIGDIIATCTSPLSRNYQVGFRLGRGETLEAITQSMNQVAEGVGTTAVLFDYAERHGIAINLTRGLYHLLYKGVALAEVRRMVMQTQSVYEVDNAR